MLLVWGRTAAAVSVREWDPPSEACNRKGGHSVIQSLYDTIQHIRYITIHKIHNNLHEPFSVMTKGGHL